MFGRTLNGGLLSILTVSLLTLGITVEVDAGPRGRANARASINRPHAGNVQRAQHIPVQRNVGHRNNAMPRNNAAQRNNHINSNRQMSAGNRVGNRNTRVNNSVHNVNIDNHRDVDIDVDGRGRYGYDDHYHPIATAAAVTATVAVTSAVVGAIFSPAQIPSDCVQVMRYNTAYMQCGSTWFQPQYQGSNVTYVVVNAP
ncbi:hypothetical protein [Pseudomonas abietaniphila]|jgi:hypothetical protein